MGKGDFPDGIGRFGGALYEPGTALGGDIDALEGFAHPHITRVQFHVFPFEGADFANPHTRIQAQGNADVIAGRMLLQVVQHPLVFAQGESGQFGLTLLRRKMDLHGHALPSAGLGRKAEYHLQDHHYVPDSLGVQPFLQLLVHEFLDIGLRKGGQGAESRNQVALKVGGVDGHSGNLHVRLLGGGPLPDHFREWERLVHRQSH